MILVDIRRVLGAELPFFINCALSRRTLVSDSPVDCLEFPQSPAREFTVGSVSWGHLLKSCVSHYQNLLHCTPKILGDLGVDIS